MNFYFHSRISDLNDVNFLFSLKGTAREKRTHGYGQQCGNCEGARWGEVEENVGRDKW